MPKERFEDKMKRLAEIVEKLDDENANLDESISLYEEGLKLSKELKDQLEGFKKKIDTISKGAGNE